MNYKIYIKKYGIIALTLVVAVSIVWFAGQLSAVTYEDYTYPNSTPATISSPIADATVEDSPFTISFFVPADTVSVPIAGDTHKIYYTSWEISIDGFEEYGVKSGTDLGSQSAELSVEVSGYYTIKLLVYGKDDRWYTDSSGKLMVDTTPFTNVYYRRFYSQITVMIVTQTMTTTVTQEPVTIVTTITEEGETIVSTIVTTTERTVVETLEVTVISTITEEITPFGGLIVLVSIFSIIPIRRRYRKEIE